MISARKSIPILLVAIATAACASTLRAGAAVVNGVRIAQTTVDAQVALAKKGQTGGGGQSDDEIAREVLGGLIQQELIRQEANRHVGQRKTSLSPRPSARRMAPVHRLSVMIARQVDCTSQSPVESQPIRFLIASSYCARIRAESGVSNW